MYQKKFFDYLNNGNIEKAKKLLEKGLDPNFQLDSTGGMYDLASGDRLD